jgi:hypothetical protein
VSVLDDDIVRIQLLRAWQESQPGTPAAHEEGGFVLRYADGSLEIERWPVGAQNQISVPPHLGGRRGNWTVAATFHTHPNPGPDYQQEPSLTDIRGVRDDPDLGHADYEGEFVISADWVYLIRRDGRVELVGETNAVLTTI